MNINPTTQSTEFLKGQLNMAVSILNLHINSRVWEVDLGTARWYVSQIKAILVLLSQKQDLFYYYNNDLLVQVNDLDDYIDQTNAYIREDEEWLDNLSEKLKVLIQEINSFLESTPS